MVLVREDAIENWDENRVRGSINCQMRKKSRCERIVIVCAFAVDGRERWASMAFAFSNQESVSLCSVATFFPHRSGPGRQRSPDSPLSNRYGGINANRSDWVNMSYNGVGENTLADSCDWKAFMIIWIILFSSTASWKERMTHRCGFASKLPRLIVE